jgi:hypothetical protein
VLTKEEIPIEKPAILTNMHNTLWELLLSYLPLSSRCCDRSTLQHKIVVFQLRWHVESSVKIAARTWKEPLRAHGNPQYESKKHSACSINWQLCLRCNAQAQRMLLT